MSLPKRGNSEAENEDAAEAAWTPRGKGGILRAAVSDGASEAFLSGAWSGILATTFVHGAGDLQAAADAAKGHFLDWEKDYLARRAEGGKPIAWYEEDGLAKGPFATLLGIRLDVPARGKVQMQAWGIGDCCLAVIRDGRVRHFWPITEPKDFGLFPHLLGAKRAQKDVGEPASVVAQLAAKDHVFLLTDAIANWFLNEAIAGQKPWETLAHANMPDPQTAAAFVTDLRDRHLIKNDDVTWIEVRLGGVAAGE